MIDVAEQEKRVPTADSLEALLVALAPYVGRVLMVRTYAKPARSIMDSRTPAEISVGQLQWLNLEENRYRISMNIGKPTTGQYTVAESIDLSHEISVLTDGAWRLIHSPKGPGSALTQPNTEV